MGRIFLSMGFCVIKSIDSVFLSCMIIKKYLCLAGESRSFRFQEFQVGVGQIHVLEATGPLR